MNRSYSKIRHIQEVNKRLEDRRLSVLSEQVDVSGYQGSGTNVEKVGIEDPYDMSNIKVTKEKGKVQRKPLSSSDPIYQKIKNYFEKEFSPVTVIGIEAPIDKKSSYEVHFPSKTPKMGNKTFEVTIEDIDKKDPILRKRFLGMFDDIDKSKKPEQTFRT
jgi:hypothetical protein